ncbi:MAG: cation:dicarboxylase symporter family transporter [Pseudanabaena sp. ELA607]
MKKPPQISPQSKSQSKTQANKLSAQFWKFFTSPYALALSAVIGVVLGLTLPNVAKSLQFIGKSYLDLLRLCVLPIVLTAIIISACKITKLPNAGGFVFKMITIFISAQVVTALLSLLISVISQPGANLNANTLASLGAEINNKGINYEINLNNPVIPTPENPFLDLLASTIPSNIFNALAQNRTLQVVFFSVLFGVALGLINRSDMRNRMIDGLEEVYDSFNKIVKWVNALMPIGLFSLLAAQAANGGTSILGLMLKFIVVSIATLLIVYGANFLIVWFRSKASFQQVWLASEEYTILTMATANSTSSIPSAIQCLSESLNFDAKSVNAGIPIGVVAFRYGTVAYFVTVALFASELYGMNLTFSHTCLIIIGSMFGAISSSGAIGIATLQALDILFKPLGIPLDAIMVLLIAINPVVNCFQATVNVSASVAVCSLVANLADESKLITKEQELDYPQKS